MFCGTMRENLDPFGRCDDVTIWAALEAARLAPYVSGLEGKLDAEVCYLGEEKHARLRFFSHFLFYRRQSDSLCLVSVVCLRTVGAHFIFSFVGLCTRFRVIYLFCDHRNRPRKSWVSLSVLRTHGVLHCREIGTTFDVCEDNSNSLCVRLYACTCV